MHMQITEKEKKRATIFLDILIIIAGTALSAFALNMLTIPSGLLGGGITGIAQFINFFFPINVGVFFFILNIPLMIAAYIFLGKKFSIYTIIAITLVSSFLYIFPVQQIWTENILLAAIFGGVT